MWWRTSNCRPLLIYRPREDERLSWPGHITHDNDDTIFCFVMILSWLTEDTRLLLVKIVLVLCVTIFYYMIQSI